MRTQLNTKLNITINKQQQKNNIMYRKANLLFLLNETPLHAGSGDSLGIVDMPIQRERHTGFPKIEASSLKGSIREHFGRKSENGEKDPKIMAAFGSDGNGDDKKSKAGALGFTDARLLLFPVKSMRGVFAWITCPRIINKFNEEMHLAGRNEKFQLPNINSGEGLAAIGNNLTINGKHIVLEEYTFEVNENDKNLDKNVMNDFGEFLSLELFDGNGYFAEKLMTDIVVLSDDDFKDFVNLSTEVITRTEIDNKTGTVKDGALFTEEYLPAEALMYSLALFAPEFEDKEGDKTFQDDNQLKNFYKEFLIKNPVLQIGGNATLGKGITRAKHVESANEGGTK